MSHNISGKLQQKRVYLDRIVLDLIDHLDARGLLRLTEIRGSSGRPLPAYGSADLLRGPEAARVINVTEKTLRNWRWKGGGPVYVKTGRTIAYRYVDLLAFRDRRLLANTSQKETGQ